LERGSETIKIMENWKGESDLNEIKRLNYLALGYNDIGKFPKALEYFEKSLKLELKTLAEDHP
jgi:hypothetical protein